MYSKTQIPALFRVIKDAGLDAPRSMLTADVEEISKCCNGIGADWQSEKSRAIFTRILDYAEATALIHDWEYSKSDGTKLKQQGADDDFLINGYREIDFRYPSIFSWKRWRAKAAVTAAHTLLKRLGVVAWRLSYAEQKLKTEGKI